MEAGRCKANEMQNTICTNKDTKGVSRQLREATETVVLMSLF